MLTDLLYRLRALFHRNTVEHEIDHELRFHFEQQVEKYVASGLDRAEAVRQARLKVGGLQQLKEECREARGTFTLETMIRDLGYALRMARKNPLFALAAITAIGLGIGVNTAVFTIVSGALSFDAGIEDPGRVVVASATDTLGRNVLSRSDPELRSFRSQVKTVINLAAYRYDVVKVSDKSGLQERYSCAEMSANGFEVIGRRPLIGRSFEPRPRWNWRRSRRSAILPESATFRNP
ncbi:MAG: hypothetical protein DMG57_04065 [Acidobacteria bacterium]|nr:MAG: hypothetical protein DMG57_04065 [Acidobacteriota bacterium]